MVLNINKPIGITSYDVIRKLKNKYPGQKIGHAGTLDPLAEGVLICLVGSNDTRRQAEFMNVGKEYEFEVLFGFATDTYDILGIAKDLVKYNLDEVEAAVRALIPNYVGDIMQAVPSFSAVKVKGVPLYRKTLNDARDAVESDTEAVAAELPARAVNVKSLEVIDSVKLGKSEVQKKLMELIATVKSGFRQHEVCVRWNELFESVDQNEFLLMRFRAEVSKGTYVRAIAHDIGQDLKIGACTTFIRRTKVGDFNIEESISI